MNTQRTIQTSTPWMQGLQLDQDAQAAVRFCPADDDVGVVFVRTDLPGHPEVRCCPDNLQSMPRWTSLAVGDRWVHHTEHVLAAVAFTNLDNVRIEMDSDRLPMMLGGTCFPFVEAIRKAGLVDGKAPRKQYRLKEPVLWLDAQSTAGAILRCPTMEHGRYIMAIPAEQFSVTTIFHWSHKPSIPIGVAEFDRRMEKAGDEILQARSYLIDTEKTQVKDLLGPAKDHVMQLSENCEPALALEAARHKIVDFLGDMMIAGNQITGRFIAARTGHRIHHDFLRHLILSDLLETRPA